MRCESSFAEIAEQLADLFVGSLNTPILLMETGTTTSALRDTATSSPPSAIIASTTGHLALMTLT